MLALSIETVDLFFTATSFTLWWYIWFKIRTYFVSFIWWSKRI